MHTVLQRTPSQQPQRRWLKSWSICIKTTCFSCRKWKWSWLSVFKVSTSCADKGEEEEEENPFVIERYTVANAVSKLEANAQLTLHYLKYNNLMFQTLTAENFRDMNQLLRWPCMRQQNFEELELSNLLKDCMELSLNCHQSRKVLTKSSNIFKPSYPMVQNPLTLWSWCEHYHSFCMSVIQ